MRRHLERSGASALVALGVSVLVGVAGFHWLGHMTGLDALLNTSMLLGGMGPVGELCQGQLPCTGGKLFASGYALFAGLFFITAAGFLITPVLKHIHAPHRNSEVPPAPQLGGVAGPGAVPSKPPHADAEPSSVRAGRGSSSSAE